MVFEVSLTQDDFIFFIFYASLKCTVQFSGSVSVAGREVKLKTRVQYQYEQLNVKLPHAFPVYLQ